MTEECAVINCDNQGYNLYVKWSRVYAVCHSCKDDIERADEKMSEDDSE